MALHIFKAPSLATNRVTLANNAQQTRSNDATDSADQIVVPPSPMEQAIAEAVERARAALREELTAEFEAKLTEAREAAESEGYQAGFTAGHAEGVTCGQEALQKQAETIESALTRLDTAWSDLQAEVEDSLQDLTFEAVCRIVGEQAVDAQTVAGMVRNVTQRLRDADVLRIRLHPAECNALRSALRKNEIDGLTPRLIEKLSEDATLTSGGCVVETLRGDYRATFDVQMQRLRELIAQQRDALSLPTDTVRDVRRA